MCWSSSGCSSQIRWLYFLGFTTDSRPLKPQYKIQVYDGRAAPQRRARSRAELSEGRWVQEIHGRCRRGEVESVEKHLLRGVYVYTDHEVEPLVELHDLLRGCVYGEFRRSADVVAPASAGSEGCRVGE